MKTQKQILSKTDTNKIIAILQKYVNTKGAGHISNGLCNFLQYYDEFDFFNESYDFFEIFEIPAGYIQGPRGASALRIEFCQRLVQLMKTEGIYFEKVHIHVGFSWEYNYFLRAKQETPGAKNAREKFLRWVKRNC